MTSRYPMQLMRSPLEGKFLVSFLSIFSPGDNAHIVKYKEAYFWEHQVWMVMDYVPGIAISKIPSRFWSSSAVIQVLLQLTSNQ